MTSAKNLTGDFGTLIDTIKSIEDLLFKFDVEKLDHTAAIIFAIEALNEFHSNDPVIHQDKNMAKSSKGLIFNIELVVKDKVFFIGDVIDPNSQVRPFPKKFDYTVFVDLNDQLLPFEISMMEWETLPDFIEWDLNRETWKVKYNKKLIDSAIPLYPRRGFGSKLTMVSGYDPSQGEFLPPF